jgi:SAM-dependent methyltransferase
MPELEDGFVVDGHLGGYIAGGDQATIYPELWDWFVDRLWVRSVIDVGCGEGWALRYFRKRGCKVFGVDGITQDDPDIIAWDYTLGGAPLEEHVDLAWCCEFVEHVKEQYLPNFLSSFRLAEYVALTHAMPGQAGWHHVNNQPPAYWQGVLAAIGYQLDRQLTLLARGEAAHNKHPQNHFVRSGMVFRRAG